MDTTPSLTLSYSGSSIRDLAKLPLASFSEKAIADGVPAHLLSAKGSYAREFGDKIVELEFSEAVRPCPGTTVLQGNFFEVKSPVQQLIVERELLISNGTVIVLQLTKDMINTDPAPEATMLSFNKICDAFGNSAESTQTVVLTDDVDVSLAKYTVKTPSPTPILEQETGEIVSLVLAFVFIGGCIIFTIIWNITHWGKKSELAQRAESKRALLKEDEVELDVKALEAKSKTDKKDKKKDKKEDKKEDKKAEETKPERDEEAADGEAAEAASEE